MNSVRLWYKKSGLAIYTSHLDMNRCFTRAVRRAGIPLWYTEGFNPHPYLTFLLPLPLGVTGEREPLDIRTVDDISADEIKERLNRVLPEGLEIVDVTEPVDKANAVESALYKIKLDFSSPGEAAEYARKTAEIAAGGVLEAEKRSKRGVRTVNLLEMVLSFEVNAVEDTAVIYTVLATGTQTNLNAELFAQALGTAAGIQSESTQITRKTIYKSNKEKFK